MNEIIIVVDDIDIPIIRHSRNRPVINDLIIIPFNDENKNDIVASVKRVTLFLDKDDDKEMIFIWASEEQSHPKDVTLDMIEWL
ncbi:MAG: hypothetical protein ACR2P5_03575, partial [Gammaproteobacteria bacterium]